MIKNDANENDSLAEYDGTTAVDVSTDTDNDLEDSSSEKGSEVLRLVAYFSLLDYFCIWYSLKDEEMVCSML